jgi:uncharacterized membrane protein YgcG
MTNINLNILKFWTKQEMHHQIKHQFSKFDQSNNLQHINFQSNNLHLFLLKCNKAKRGGKRRGGGRGGGVTTSCGGGGRSRQWLATVVEIGVVPAH